MIQPCLRNCNPGDPVESVTLGTDLNLRQREPAMSAINFFTFTFSFPGLTL